MKKYILILFFALGLSTQARDTTFVDKATTAVSSVATGAKDAVVSGVTYTDTSSLFKEVYHDLRDAVVAIAKALKTSAEHVMYILVRQQVMLGLLALFKLVVLISCLVWYGRYINSESYKTQASQGKFFAEIVSWLYVPTIAYVVYISYTNLLGEIAQRLGNPEYMVYLQIIDIVKSLK